MPTNDQPFDPQYGGGQATGDAAAEHPTEPQVPTLEPEVKDYPRGKPYRVVIRARIAHD